MLKNLLDLKIEAEHSIEAIGTRRLHVNQELRDLIHQTYYQKFVLGGVGKEKIKSAISQQADLVIVNKDNQTAYLSYQWFLRMKYCKEFIEALFEYSKYVDDLKSFLNQSGKVDVLKELPKIDWVTELGAPAVSLLNRFIRSKFTNPAEEILFRDFLDGHSWLDIKFEKGEKKWTGKKLDRSRYDYISSSVKKIAKLIDANAGKFDDFMKIYIESTELRGVIDNAIVSEDTIFTAGSAENKIFYGAPGTSKSYEIGKIATDENSIRTVFHPDSQYSDFVGCLKPKMNGTSVAYEFRPGPFVESIRLAFSNPSINCFLVIEEINRASAAAVFGEIFQLLDRDKLGRSTYSIDISDPDLKAYLEKNAPGSIESDKLRIPQNLSLLATMNNSDQAVMPMDTAFKRRWKFRYMGLDFENCPSGIFDIKVGKDSLRISWKNFALIINEELARAEIPEDRHLGPWFVSEQEILDGEACKMFLSGKLFIYLWDDVLRHSPKQTIFSDTILNYGQLYESFITNNAVFNDELTAKFRERAVPELDGENTD